MSRFSLGKVLTLPVTSPGAPQDAAPETPDAANPQREEISEEDVTADDAANLGLGETADALVENLGEGGVLSAESAQYLADAANAERYGISESSPSSSAVHSALDDCVAELRAHASHSQRFLAVVWPRSLWGGPTPTPRS